MAAPSDGILTFSGNVDAEEEIKETSKLRKALFEDFTMFLLNNILMSVQFFENYEREMQELRDSCLSETSLDSDNFKSFDADTLHKLISTRVTFQSRSTAKKSKPELLHPLRTYVTYHNVELANNSSIYAGKKIQQNPHYRLIVQRCEDDKIEASGYVNIVEPPSVEDKPEPSTIIYHPDNHDERDEKKRKQIQSGLCLAKNDTFYILEPEKRSKPYPLRDYRTYERISQTSAIPKSCYKEHEKQFMGNKRRTAVVLGKTKTKTTRKMLVSAAFKRHFSEVFAVHLSGQIGLTKLETATFHLDHVSVNTKYETHHVIPVLEMKEWPQAIKIEIVNEEKRGLEVEWPTTVMQRTIQKLGCSLVPMGYHETTEENADYTLEWKLEFPKAEKYLMTHTMHTHVRCYLFMLTLHKTFIGSDLTAPHFGPSHITNLLLLMLRKNFLAWPEYSQGETLTKYLRILEKTLQKRCLKSFFLPNRNLYANSPQRILHKAQTVIARMLENPIPYILKALMNLKFKDDFYPEFDYLRLYNVLTVDNLSEYLYPTPPKKVKGRKKQPEPKVKPKETVDESELVEEKNTPLKREEVLCMFIDHFIKVANKSREYKSYEYSMLYLIQARRLNVLLSEESTTRGKIEDFNERIHNGIEFCRKAASKCDGNARPMKDITNRTTLRRQASEPQKIHVRDIQFAEETRL